MEQLASNIARWEPGIRGFSRSNLLRMRQFYETYRDDQIVAPLREKFPGHTNCSQAWRLAPPKAMKIG